MELGSERGLPPPRAFVQLSEVDDADQVDDISRVTMHLGSVRERSHSEPQPFPPGAYVGFEVQISHQDPAFILPDKILDAKPLRIDSLGWVSDPRVVIVLNRTRWRGSSQPTLAQEQEIAESIILVGFDGEQFPLEIRPGQQQPLLLSPQSQVWVRACSGQPVVSVFLV